MLCYVLDAKLEHCSQMKLKIKEFIIASSWAFQIWTSCYVLNFWSKTLLQERGPFFVPFDFIFTILRYVTNLGCTQSHSTIFLVWPSLIYTHKKCGVSINNCSCEETKKERQSKAVSDAGRWCSFFSSSGQVRVPSFEPWVDSGSAYFGLGMSRAPQLIFLYHFELLLSHSI